VTRARVVRVVLKPLVFVLCAVPFVKLVWLGYQGDLTANPVDYITKRTGTWALTLLVVSLAVTPARQWLRFSELVRLRRMLGLFAFFYAVLHFLTWSVFDHVFDLVEMASDVVKRPYITAGMTAFAIMLPLAITSTEGMIRRLGRRWQALHRLVYVAAIAAVLHYWWLVKADTRLPRQFAVAVTLLLGYRLVRAWFRGRARAPSA